MRKIKTNNNKFSINQSMLEIKQSFSMLGEKVKKIKNVTSII